MGWRKTTWLAAVRLVPEADCARESSSTKVWEVGLCCQSRMMLPRWPTAPCRVAQGTPNSAMAAATLRLRSSNCTKRITLAVGSSSRSSRSLRTRTASLAPYLSKRTPCRVSSTGAAAVDDEEGVDPVLSAGAACGSSSATSSATRGRTSRLVSVRRQMLQWPNFSTVAARQSMQKVCAQGVMASLARGKLSSMQTVQLRSSGRAESAAKAFSVR
mmetsp:Transcript_94796/g.171168  ORF Transcript_94796/g.171168 Transcript_94796/m.171168 type:complete len:215 (+) Transcript_94796:370-1014(+)